MSSDLLQIASRFEEQSILVLGDVMLDWFIWGNVSRISPEAPVPVVEVQSESRYPGGAANVARNITPFAKSVELAGLYGCDANGHLLLETLKNNGIGIEGLLEIEGFPTISKTRVVALQQQVVRIDREKKFSISSEQEAQLLESIRLNAASLDGIIIEDYGKGLITPSLVEGVVKLANEHNHIVTVDPKPGNPIPWNSVTCVKPNRNEAFAAAGIEDLARNDELPPLEDAQLLKAGHLLLDRWSSDHVLITLGELGMVLFSKENPEDHFHIPTQAREVFDVSGAGDTAIAILTLALCAGADMKQAACLSNIASGIVVGKLGTAPIEKEEFLTAVSQ